MTTIQELEQQHLEAINNQLWRFGAEEAKAAQSCARITIDFTVKVLEELLPDKNLSNFEYAMWKEALIYKIETKISELQNQKEG